MKREDYLKCLRVSITCIGDEGMIHSLDKVSIKELMLEHVVTYLKIWKIMTCEFGTLCSTWLVLIVTSSDAIFSNICKTRLVEGER